ncbi:MAG: extracellular solute-binding protein [Myxococcota bacterium]
MNLRVVCWSVKNLLAVVVLFPLLMCKPTGDRSTLTVFAAASMGPTLKALEDRFEADHPDVDVRVELSGSRLACAKIADQQRRADIVISADHTLLDQMLIPVHASFKTLFADNALVLAYERSSPWAKRLTEEPWQKVLSHDDIAIGYANPALAPVGYRTLLALKLNDRVASDALRLGETIASRLLKRHQRPDVAQLLAPLQAGEVDVAFLYRTEAQQYGLPYVSLDPRIDFSKTEHEALYNSVEVEIPGLGDRPARTARGSSLVYGLTVPRDATSTALATSFVKFMLSETGQKLAAASHLNFFSPKDVRTHGVPPPGLRLAGMP